MRQRDVDVFDGEFGFREASALSFGMSQAAGHLSFQSPPDVMEGWQGKGVVTLTSLGRIEANSAA